MTRERKNTDFNPFDVLFPPHCRRSQWLRWKRVVRQLTYFNFPSFLHEALVFIWCESFNRPLPKLEKAVAEAECKPGFRPRGVMKCDVCRRLSLMRLERPLPALLELALQSGWTALCFHSFALCSPSSLHACLPVSMRLLLCSIVAWTVYYCRMFVLAPRADIPPTIAATTISSSTATPGERKLPGQRKSRDPL